MNEYNITQLNDGTVGRFLPQIDGNNVVWAGSDGNDDEIFLYNGSETIQLTNNEVVDTDPRVNGNNIVWSSGLGIQSEIFLYDGSETIQITDNEVQDSAPQIDGNNIVWLTGDFLEGQIFFNNGSETIQLTNNDLDNTFIDISDGNLAWSSSDTGFDDEVFFYNGSEIVQLSDSDNEPHDHSPRISGNNVVWQSGLFSTKILFYNGSETVQIGNGADPQISGNNVVWGYAPLGSDREIFLYNGSETIQLTNNEVDDTLGENTSVNNNIDGNKVVWQSGSRFGNDSEIFFYNGSEVIQLTDNDVRDFNPQISGDNIIWQTKDASDVGNENVDLFLATPLEIESIPGAVYRFFNSDTGVHFYTANETERDTVQELDNFSFEGASYLSVDTLTGNPEATPVYRFLNQDTGVHLYTVSETERDVVENLDNFSFEGEALFAYATEVEGSIPIYRFFNSITGAHFYTSSKAERDNVEDSLLDFQFEGVAYYALPIESGVI